MSNELKLYLQIANLFESKGFHLYLVGGTVRDFLMRIPLTDMDVVTDATPDDMKVFLKSYSVDYTFSKFGSVKLTLDNCKFDITTLRKETGYKDARHPGKIAFVKHLDQDVVRRDFTVNAMYMDYHFRLYDFYTGEDDLNKGILRMVGNPDKRLKEDPLRIIRAARFALTYKLKLEARLKKAILRNVSLLKKLNPQKIKQDLQKIQNCTEEEKSKLFIDLGIKEVLDVLD